MSTIGNSVNPRVSTGRQYCTFKVFWQHFGLSGDIAPGVPKFMWTQHQCIRTPAGSACLLLSTSVHLSVRIPAILAEQQTIQRVVHPGNEVSCPVGFGESATRRTSSGAC